MLIRRKTMMSTVMHDINVIQTHTNLVSSRVVRYNSYTASVVCDTDCEVYLITIKMGGVDITSTAYDATYNMISIASVTGDVDIECYAMHTMPSDYIKVDGIKNPSNAYLDTGQTITPTSRIYVEYESAGATYAEIFIDRATGLTSQNGTAFLHRNGNTQIIVSGSMALANLRTGIEVGTKFSACIDNNKGKAYYNGVALSSFKRRQGNDSGTMRLFGLTTGSGANGIAYTFRIYDYSTTSYVRYYIPCLNDSGVAGFWDAARGVFQGSSNSTAFEAVAADGGDFRLINFEDSAVKNICVTNWGGHYKAGEMYTPEARAVTTLSNKFENNANIVKFNELQYFTGLTTLTTYREGQYIGGMPYFGAFHHCSNLEEITLPTITMSGSKIGGLFYGCSKLKTVDMSPITISGTAHICNICGLCSALTSAILPTVSVSVTYLAAIYAFQKCTSLLTVDASRVNFANMNFTNSSNIFPDATKLTRIIGGLSGFRNTESSIKFCPLTHDAAVELLESLGTVTSARTLTLKTSTYNTLTAEEKAIATNKGWTLNYYG